MLLSASAHVRWGAQSGVGATWGASRRGHRQCAHESIENAPLGHRERLPHGRLSHARCSPKEVECECRPQKGRGAARLGPIPLGHRERSTTTSLGIRRRRARPGPRHREGPRSDQRIGQRSREPRPPVWNSSAVKYDDSPRQESDPTNLRRSELERDLVQLNWSQRHGRAILRRTIP